MHLQVRIKTKPKVGLLVSATQPPTRKEGAGGFFNIRADNGICSWWAVRFREIITLSLRRAQGTLMKMGGGSNEITSSRWGVTRKIAALQLTYGSNQCDCYTKLRSTYFASRQSGVANFEP